VSDNRERDVTRAFVTLASSLANGYDVVDLLSGLVEDCAQLLDITSAGILLADGLGDLHVMAASSTATRELEVFQSQRDEGPCRDCHRDGTPINVPDLRAEVDRWPQFVPAAVAAGFGAVHAVPMRARENILGALGLFSASVGPLPEDDLLLAQGLADVASVALIQDRATIDRAEVVDQLQHALNSRVVLEQAKGVVAHVGNLDMRQAFGALRRYSRDHNLRLSDVAASIVTRSLSPQVVLDHSVSGGPAQRQGNASAGEESHDRSRLDDTGQR
jgi:hypothetical protein